MNDLFFAFAVIGPTATQRVGVVAGCEECRKTQDPRVPCAGFGPGCLGFRAASPEKR